MIKKYSGTLEYHDGDQWQEVEFWNIEAEESAINLVFQLIHKAGREYGIFSSKSPKNVKKLVLDKDRELGGDALDENEYDSQLKNDKDDYGQILVAQVGGFKLIVLGVCDLPEDRKMREMGQPNLFGTCQKPTLTGRELLKAANGKFERSPYISQTPKERKLEKGEFSILHYDNGIDTFRKVNGWTNGLLGLHKSNGKWGIFHLRSGFEIGWSFTLKDAKISVGNLMELANWDCSRSELEKRVSSKAATKNIRNCIVGNGQKLPSEANSKQSGPEIPNEPVKPLKFKKGSFETMLGYANSFELEGKEGYIAENKIGIYKHKIASKTCWRIIHLGSGSMVAQCALLKDAKEVSQRIALTLSDDEFWGYDRETVMDFLQANKNIANQIIRIRGEYA